MSAVIKKRQNKWQYLYRFLCKCTLHRR